MRKIATCQQALREALTTLSEFARRIFQNAPACRLAATLEELAYRFRISREREMRAFEEIRKAVRNRVAMAEAAR